MASTLLGLSIDLGVEVDHRRGRAEGVLLLPFEDEVGVLGAPTSLLVVVLVLGLH